MNDYKFTFGYLALKMLGKTLYSNPFAALSELIANGFDAKANKVWVYIDIREKSRSEIVVIDNGFGMSDADVRDKYLQVGKKNRADQDNEMMGRKGIGKLAAFYLSNKYYLITKTLSDENIYEIDFTLHENGIKSEADDTYMKRVSKFKFPNEEKYSSIATGTAIYLTDVNFVGYGEKSFDVLESELSELFSIKKNSKNIYLKIVRSDYDLENEFISVRKKIAFKNMSKIFYNLSDSEFTEVLALNGRKIKNAEKQSNETTIVTDVERYTKEPRESKVGGQNIQINPKGWIGLHQTINRDIAHSNDPENFINSKFYHFNKIRVYVRGKLALENILPYVHNTQYYVNYIEGEIQCDELDDNNFPDIASSSRQDIDKNDDRFIALVEYVKDIVASLVHFKNDQTNRDLELKKKQQKSAVNFLANDVGAALGKTIGKSIKPSDIEEIKHSINNSFEKTQDVVKTNYIIFLSHKRDDKYISDFIYYYLTDICGFDENLIFYTSKSGGIDESVETLERQINSALTNTNSYAVFCIGSENFMSSQFCMFEGGAAWATKQKDVIGLIYNDYDHYVPEYLKPMKKIKLNFSNPTMSRDLYISIVNLMNSLIDYLNRNFADESNKKNLIKENAIPNDAELLSMHKSIDEFYNESIIRYWNNFVLSKS